MHHVGSGRARTALMPSPRAAVVAVLAVLLIPIASLAPTRLVAAAAGPTTTRLVPLTPCRLADTRDRTEPPASVTVPSRGRCDIPVDAIALSVVVTVAGTTAESGFVTVWSGSGTKPDSSNLNWSGRAETRANSTIVLLSPDGRFEVTPSTPTPLIVDVTAAFTPVAESSSGRLVTVEPTRVLDTRSSTVAVGSGSTVEVRLGTVVPSDAVAVAANITVVDSDGAGFVSVSNRDRPVRDSSVLNTDAAGQTRSAGVIVPVSADGFDVYVSFGTHVVVDVTGWFTGPSAVESDVGLFVPVDGVRVLDTRATTARNSGSLLLVELPDLGGPTAAVAASVTMVDPADVGWLSVYPSDTATPATSTVNGTDRIGATANTTVVGVGARGLAVETSVRTHVAVDIVGRFTGPPRPSDGTRSVSRNELSPLPDRPDCAMYPRGRAALVDRIHQMAWLCLNGLPASGYLPFTAGPVEDAPKGEYRVFFKRHPWAGGGQDLQRFTAFTRGNEGGRVAFHRYVEMPESSVGSEEFRNASSGCLRLRARDAVTVWNFLQIGDRVRVLNNA